MPHRLLLNSRAERIAREHDDAAQWLAEHDATRIAAEREAKRAEAKRQDEGKRAGRKAATLLTVL
jgi:F0F1-type ATP synthase membrane subunit b/b'